MFQLNKLIWASLLLITLGFTFNAYGSSPGDHPEDLPSNRTFGGVPHEWQDEIQEFIDDADGIVSFVNHKLSGQPGSPESFTRLHPGLQSGARDAVDYVQSMLSSFQGISIDPEMENQASSRSGIYSQHQEEQEESPDNQSLSSSEEEEGIAISKSSAEEVASLIPELERLLHPGVGGPYSTATVYTQAEWQEALEELAYRDFDTRKRHTTVPIGPDLTHAAKELSPKYAKLIRNGELRLRKEGSDQREIQCYRYYQIYCYLREVKNNVPDVQEVAFPLILGGAAVIGPEAFSATCTMLLTALTILGGETYLSKIREEIKEEGDNIESFPHHHPDIEELAESYPWAESFSELEVNITPVDNYKTEDQGFIHDPEVDRASIFSTPTVPLSELNILLRQWSIPNEALDKIPSSFGKAQPTKKNSGLKWSDKHGGNYIRLQPADPNSPHSSQCVDYVRINSNGEVIGQGGHVLRGDDPASSEQAHIPLSEWLNWTHWNRP